MKSPASGLAIIGGGPAGLRAAEILSATGAQVHLYDQKPSVGRKFLVAGHGGLNLTHSEPLTTLITRYADSARWTPWLKAWGPAEMRDWAKGLGVETFIGTSGRVFPLEKKAAPLLRRWVSRLRQQGVVFHLNHRWIGLQPGAPLTLEFLHHDQTVSVTAHAVVLALGGASWPETGSDGTWTTLLEKHGVALTPLQAANCGYEVVWPDSVLSEAEGEPLKNITVTAGPTTVCGELLITRYGVEGGALYQLGRELRTMEQPALTIDFKPTFTIEQLAAKLGRTAAHRLLPTAHSAWRLSPPALALLATRAPFADATTLAQTAKSFALTLTRPRPIAEAISTAGGVAWSELNEHLMLHQIPGVFVAGEMLDWDAPTGGYLLQGCWTTGTIAGQHVITYLRR